MKLTIFEVYRLLGGRLRGISGGTQQCKCILPSHPGEDSKPSAKLYSDTDKYYCYVCGGPFDPIGFYMTFKNLSYKKAVVELRNHGYEIVFNRRQVKVNIDVRKLKELGKQLGKDFDQGVNLTRGYYKGVYNEEENGS